MGGRAWFATLCAVCCLHARGTRAQEDDALPPMSPPPELRNSAERISGAAMILRLLSGQVGLEGGARNIAAGGLCDGSQQRYAYPLTAHFIVSFLGGYIDTADDPPLDNATFVAAHIPDTRDPHAARVHTAVHVLFANVLAITVCAVVCAACVRLARAHRCPTWVSLRLFREGADVQGVLRHPSLAWSALSLVYQGTTIAAVDVVWMGRGDTAPWWWAALGIAGTAAAAFAPVLAAVCVYRAIPNRVVFRSEFEMLHNAGGASPPGALLDMDTGDMASPLNDTYTGLGDRSPISVPDGSEARMADDAPHPLLRSPARAERAPTTRAPTTATWRSRLRRWALGAGEWLSVKRADHYAKRYCAMLHSIGAPRGGLPRRAPSVGCMGWLYAWTGVCAAMPLLPCFVASSWAIAIASTSAVAAQQSAHGGPDARSATLACGRSCIAAGVAYAVSAACIASCRPFARPFDNVFTSVAEGLHAAAVVVAGCEYLADTTPVGLAPQGTPGAPLGLTLWAPTLLVAAACVTLVQAILSVVSVVLAAVSDRQESMQHRQFRSAAPDSVEDIVQIDCGSPPASPHGRDCSHKQLPLLSARPLVAGIACTPAVSDTAVSNPPRSISLECLPASAAGGSFPSRGHAPAAAVVDLAASTCSTSSSDDENGRSRQVPSALFRSSGLLSDTNRSGSAFPPAVCASPDPAHTGTSTGSCTLQMPTTSAPPPLLLGDDTQRGGNRRISSTSTAGDPRRTVAGTITRKSGRSLCSNTLRTDASPGLTALRPRGQTGPPPVLADASGELPPLRISLPPPEGGGDERPREPAMPPLLASTRATRKTNVNAATVLLQGMRTPADECRTNPVLLAGAGRKPRLEDSTSLVPDAMVSPCASSPGLDLRRRSTNNSVILGVRVDESAGSPRLGIHRPLRSPEPLVSTPIPPRAPSPHTASDVLHVTASTIGRDAPQPRKSSGSTPGHMLAPRPVSQLGANTPSISTPIRVFPSPSSRLLSAQAEATLLHSPLTQM